ADIGSHQFTYSLYPHQGNWEAANVTREGYELNHEVSVIETRTHKGTLPNRHRFITIDAQSVVIDTVKHAENHTGFIFRLYESSGGREQVNLQLEESIGTVEETNLLEEAIAHIKVDNNQINIDCKPFE